MFSKRVKNDEVGGGGTGSVSNIRIYVVILFILFSSCIVFLRLYVLQVKAHEQYKGYADNQHKLRQTILPLRGEIFLREKEGLFPIAVNRELMTAFVIPKEIEDPEIAARAIAEMLDLEYEEIIGKLSKSNDLYEVLKRKISSEEVEAIKNSQIRGLHMESQRWRYYPGSNLASHVVGFVGYDGDQIKGRYGAESFFEEQLRGSRGILEQDRDTFGRWISVGSKSITPAQNGDSVVLSLDHVLQFKAELALKNAVERHEADGGKVIIVEPYSGKILAMAAYPSFNLNEYSSVEDMSVYSNPIISDTYECGSVFKAITMAAGLDMDKVQPDTTYVDTGAISEAGFTIQNSDFKSHGKQTMTNVIEKSLNTGAIFVEREIGNQHFLRYIRDFGFGKKTGVQAPGETSGNISNLLTNRDIEFYTASFGQGITVSPLQLTMAYAALANGGELNKPQLVEKIMQADGQEMTFEKEYIKSVISRRAANQLALMLESNIVNGHGKLAGVPGYRVAGKTGTAQIPDREKGGYLENATTGTFAGFAPVDNPAFAMVVIIDYPKDVEWAESTAGPVFGELSKFMFDYFGIEPTEEFTSEDLATFSKTHNYLAEEETEEAEEVEEIEEDEDDKKKKKDDDDD